MITTSSTVWATSARRWLDTSTVPPSSAKPRRNCRSQWTPSGSRPLAGSSRISTAGLPSKAPARPRRWRMPSEKPLTRRSAASARPTSSSTSSTRAARQPAGGGEHAQVVARPPAGMEAGRLEHRADVPGRVGELVRRAARRWWRVPPVGLARPSSIRRVVVLPAPLGPRNPVTAPSRAVKLRSSTAVTPPNRLDSPLISIAGMGILPWSSSPSTVRQRCRGVAGRRALAGLPRVAL